MQYQGNMQGTPSEMDLDQYLDSFLSSMQQNDGRGNPGANLANLQTTTTPSMPNFQRPAMDSPHPLGYPLTLGYFPGSNPLQFGLFNSQTNHEAFQSAPTMALPQAQQAAQLQAQAALVAQQHAAARQGQSPIQQQRGFGGNMAPQQMQGMGQQMSQGQGRQQNWTPQQQQQQQQQQLQQQQQQQLQQLQQLQQSLLQQQQLQPPQMGGRKGGRGGGRGKAADAEGSSGDNTSGSELDSSDEGGGGGGGGKKPRKRRELATDEAERRHEKLQEKNRRAQRRFRERQKVKLTELHKQIEELAGKVGSLQTENSALQSRTSILEKVLDMRNEQIQVMQETKEKRGTEDDAGGLQGMGSHMVQLTPEVVKELTPDQIYKIYQTYVKELSVRLAESENVGPDGETPEQQLELEQLVKDLTMIVMRLGVIKPLETRKFIVMSRQYLGNTEAEVIELWKNVIRDVGLGEASMREIVNLKRMFLQRIEPIMEERKRLNVQIQSNLPLDTFHTKNALTYIKAHEAVIKLRDNLRAEQHIVLEYAIAVFRGVFKPRQMATLLVKCYPAVPDGLGIASALAIELGQPESEKAVQLAMQLGGYTLQGAARPVALNQASGEEVAQQQQTSGQFGGAAGFPGSGMGGSGARPGGAPGQAPRRDG